MHKTPIEKSNFKNLIPSLDISFFLLEICQVNLFHQQPRQPVSKNRSLLVRIIMVYVPNIDSLSSRTSQMQVVLSCLDKQNGNGGSACCTFFIKVSIA